MFIVVDEPTFAHAVKVLVPVDGGHEPQSFKAVFKVLATDREAEFDLSTATGSTEFLRAIVVGMDELVDAAGAPLPYSDALRDRLLRLPFVRVALVKAYFEAIRKATEGN